MKFDIYINNIKSKFTLNIYIYIYIYIKKGV